MTKLEIEVAKENIRASGDEPIVSVCQDCEREYDVSPGGKNYPPELRTSHGSCSECEQRVRDRFLNCKDTEDVK